MGEEGEAADRVLKGEGMLTRKACMGVPLVQSEAVTNYCIRESKE